MKIKQMCEIPFFKGVGGGGGALMIILLTSHKI